MTFGATNPGNMCYMNSVLFALVHVPLFLELLSAQALPSPSSPVPRAFLRFVRSLTSSPVAVNARAFHNACAFAGSRLLAQFADGEQEDANEFLLALLDRLWQSPLRTAIDAAFSFVQTTNIECSLATCSQKNRKTKTLHTLELPLPESLPPEYRDSLPLTYLVDEYFDVEWHESRCHGDEKALRGHQHTITRFPQFLLATICRFRADHVKLKTHVVVARSLPVLDARFELVSLVLHHGARADQGHYTAVGTSSSSGV